VSSLADAENDAMSINKLRGHGRNLTSIFELESDLTLFFNVFNFCLHEIGQILMISVAFAKVQLLKKKLPILH